MTGVYSPKVVVETKQFLFADAKIRNKYAETYGAIE